MDQKDCLFRGYAWLRELSADPGCRRGSARGTTGVGACVMFLDKCSEPGWAQERKEKSFVLFSGARCSGPG